MNKNWLPLLRIVIFLVIALIGTSKTVELATVTPEDSTDSIQRVDSPAGKALGELPVKGRAPKTGYSRAQFGDGWATNGICDVRNQVLARDLTDAVVDSECHVLSGILNDPYSGKTVQFQRGADTSDDIQIDHVVALSDAWQKGAQQLSYEKRQRFANDTLGLLAVDGALNQQKGDGDAATWLPPNKQYRCSYVARQIAVKKKYSLWVTRSEYDAIADILRACPEQQLPQ